MPIGQDKNTQMCRATCLQIHPDWDNKYKGIQTDRDTHKDKEIHPEKDKD